MFQHTGVATTTCIAADIHRWGLMQQHTSRCWGYLVRLPASGVT